jgi:poly-beta-1,6-N-acetyl-D-glucosamine N-deacetylase
LLPKRIRKALKRLLLSAIFAVLRFSGLSLLVREIWQRNKVTILVYHALSATRADAHFSALTQRYNVIALSEFVSARSAQRTDRLPRKALIITFDDGHRANYELLPVLEKHGIPISIFVCSGIVGTHRHFWWSHASDEAGAQALKALPDEQRVQVLLTHGHTDTREYETRQSLSVDEIAAMKSLVDFQSHTVFHPILPTCTLERAQREIVDSKETLEKQYGLKIYALAYPNGDYSDQDVELLRAAGYSCGLTMTAGFNDWTTDPLRLRRFALPDDAGLNELIVKASGLWGVAKSLYRTRLVCPAARITSAWHHTVWGAVTYRRS